jgi:hypothetical protein
MQSILEILDFYKSLRNAGDLFKGSPFSDHCLYQIEEDIRNKNQEFFGLIFRLAHTNDFNYKVLEITFNELTGIYWEIDGELKKFKINALENTPLFKFKIKFDGALLTSTMSEICILNGISEIYFYLETNFSKELNLKERLIRSNYVPAYLDKEGYLRHIYYKLIRIDSLETEFYNYKEYQVQKISEFLQIIPSDILVGLPIDYRQTLMNEDQNYSVNDENVINFFIESEIMPDTLLEVDDMESEVKISSEVQFTPKSRSLLNFIGVYVEKNNENDLTKDFFYSLRDYFMLFPQETSLSTFRKLFIQGELEEKIVVSDSKKLVAIIKFLKAKNILSTHNHYLEKITYCFIEANNKNINVKSLHGSKRILNLNEEKKLNNLFGANS